MGKDPAEAESESETSNIGFMSRRKFNGYNYGVIVVCRCKYISLASIRNMRNSTRNMTSEEVKNSGNK